MPQFIIPKPTTRAQKEAFCFMATRHFARENLRAEEPLFHMFGDHTTILQNSTLHSGDWQGTVAAGRTEILFEIITGNPDDAVLTDAQTFDIHTGATLTHVRMHIGGHQHVIHRKVTAKLAENAVYNQFTLTTGAAASRVETHAYLEGEHAHVNLQGLNLIEGSQKADSWADIQFIAPNCTANVEQRQILDGSAHASFQGKFHVHQAAQKTDAYMMCKNLLLSEGARTSQKPELEIYADDVKCSHGTTTGQLDDEALFYLAARGIPAHKARAMLIQAFAQEIASKLEYAPAHTAVHDHIETYLTK